MEGGNLAAGEVSTAVRRARQRPRSRLGTGARRPLRGTRSSPLPELPTLPTPRSQPPPGPAAGSAQGRQTGPTRTRDPGRRCASPSPRSVGPPLASRSVWAGGRPEKAAARGHVPARPARRGAGRRLPAASRASASRADAGPAPSARRARPPGKGGGRAGPRLGRASLKVDLKCSQERAGPARLRPEATPLLRQTFRHRRAAGGAPAGVGTAVSPSRLGQVRAPGAARARAVVEVVVPRARALPPSHPRAGLRGDAPRPRQWRLGRLGRAGAGLGWDRVGTGREEEAPLGAEA